MIFYLVMTLNMIGWHISTESSWNEIIRGTGRISISININISRGISRIITNE